MQRWAVASALALCACGGSAGDVVLELQGGCAPDAGLEEVTVISVEVYGLHDGAPCILRSRCIFGLDMPATLDDVAEALRGATPPLVEVAAEDALVLGLIGHRTSCWGADDRILCGFADLAEADDGVLEVGLACGNCDDEEIPFCP